MDCSGSPSKHFPQILKYYTGHCHFSGSSRTVATIVQILLRTKCFTDSLTQTPDHILRLFLKLYKEIANNKPWLDINSLIESDEILQDDTSELNDCLSGLFQLFSSSIPHIASRISVISDIPYTSSIAEYFSELGSDSIAHLDVIFFETRFLVLRSIPDTLGVDGTFSLYVVVTRFSKTNLRLCFRDSEGWLEIYGRNIKEIPSFYRDNISFLGYIRDVNFTNVFRCRLNCNHIQRNPRKRTVPDEPLIPNAEMPIIASSSTEPAILESFCCFPSSLPESPLAVRSAARVQIKFVFWADPEKSPWGSEQRKALDIAGDATGNDLLKAVGESLDVAQDLSTRYEILKVSSDFEASRIISPTEPMDATNGDIFQIQPIIPSGHACPVVLMIGSESEEHRIDFRRICISSGQLNLSHDIPQNSFRSIAATLVGGFDYLSDVSVVMEEDGVRTGESSGIFVLPQSDQEVKRICYVRIFVKDGFSGFDLRLDDRRDHEDKCLQSNDRESVTAASA